jgi:hypothetical protein
MEPIVCTPKRLPEDLLIEAARVAKWINPANAPALHGLIQIVSALKNLVDDDKEELSPQHIAVMTTKYWGPTGVNLSVSFMDNPPVDLRKRILANMEIWGQHGNVRFQEVPSNGQVRIARTPGQGHYSYLGTDILSIPANQPTMNLDSFTMNTPESEFHRVVRHECGHTLGFPHEHMRADIVARIDQNKAIRYFRQTQGWSAQETMQQVLKPLNESGLITEKGQAGSDTVSIMSYQLPGAIMVDGIAVPGGTDLDARDKAFAAQIYPLAVAPTPPPVPPPAKPLQITLSGTDMDGTYTLTKV